MIGQLLGNTAPPGQPVAVDTSAFLFFFPGNLHGAATSGISAAASTNTYQCSACARTPSPLHELRGVCLIVQGEMAAWLIVTTLILEYILVGGSEC